MNLTTSTVGTAVGLSTDLSHGSDRPPAHAAHVAHLDPRGTLDLRPAGGRAVQQRSWPLTGLVVGWRPTTSVAEVLAGFGVALLFSYALTLAERLSGHGGLGRRVGAGHRLHRHLSAGLRVERLRAHAGHARRGCATIANWNPVSAVASACRVLFGNPNPSARDPGLAHAAPGRGGGHLVAGHPRGGRAARRAPLPQAHARLGAAKEQTPQRILMERSWASQQRRADCIRHPDWGVSPGAPPARSLDPGDRMSTGPAASRLGARGGGRLVFRRMARLVSAASLRSAPRRRGSVVPGRRTAPRRARWADCARVPAG